MVKGNICKRNYTAVIQVGGLGTRMLELTKDEIPKPLLMINGKPMIERQMENLAEYGIRKFVVILGHLGEKIENYFGDGSKWNYEINYIREKEPLGSGGALAYLNDYLVDEDVILVFGDVMFCLDWNRFIEYHEEHSAGISLLVHPNSHPYDSDVILMDTDGRVTGLGKKGIKRDYWYKNRVNAGLYIIGNNVLKESFKEVIKRDLESDVIVPMISEGKVYGYTTSEYVKDAGTPERYTKCCEEEKQGVWIQRCLKNKQSCIFLDRDGTINEFKGLISCDEDICLEQEVCKAIRLINESGMLAIIVTNQPVVARGMCTIADVERMHDKIETLLGEEGTYVDDIIFCPHHPDRGYPEENPEYKVECECRKPKIGMIKKMAEVHNIDLTSSYMIGDSTVDIQTGINAGLKTVLVKTGVAGTDKKFNVNADFEAINLLEAVQMIIK